MPDDDVDVIPQDKEKRGPTTWGDYVFDPKTGKYKPAPNAKSGGAGGSINLDWLKGGFGGGDNGMGWGALIGGLIGGAGGYLGGKEASKPRKDYTDSTTEQVPFLWDDPNWGTAGDIGSILELQRALVERGAPQVGPGGLTYGTYGRGPTGAAPTAPAPPPAPTGGGTGKMPKGKAPSPSRAPATQPGDVVRPDGRIIRNGKTIYTPPAAAKSGGKQALPTPGAGQPRQIPARPASAEDIFRQVAERGFDAAGSPLVKQGETAIGNILGTAGGGGPETTGYDRYNPINQALASRLMGEDGNQVGRDLLMKFLDENQRGVTGGDGGGGQPPGGRNVIFRSNNASATGGGGGGAGAGGLVPDTMAQESFFADETRKMFDQGPDPELDALIAAMNKDVEEGMFRDLAALDAASQGAGRFGGDLWGAAAGDARERAAEEMAMGSSKLRMGDREAMRQARLAALGLVSNRDLAAMQDKTQREGIAASERAAGASAGAGAQAAADQIALAKRGQDLSAIGALLGHEEFGTGTLAGLGEGLSRDRLTALGAIPDISGIGLSGVNLALGGGGGLTDLRDIASREKIAGQQTNVARQGMNQQAQMFNSGQAQAQVNDYMRTLLAVGGMGGRSHTEGLNVVPGTGNPWSSAAMGALGGAATGAGIYQGYRG